MVRGVQGMNGVTSEYRGDRGGTGVAGGDSCGEYCVLYRGA